MLICKHTSAASSNTKVKLVLAIIIFKHFYKYNCVIVQNTRSLAKRLTLVFLMTTNCRPKFVRRNASFTAYSFFLPIRNGTNLHVECFTFILFSVRTASACLYFYILFLALVGCNNLRIPLRFCFPWAILRLFYFICT